MKAPDHWVYELYDAGGSLLYVGVTWRNFERLAAHQEQPWSAEIATILVEHYATREAALARERALIAEREPRYNRSANPAWRGDLGENLSVEEVAAEMQVSAKTVFRQIHGGALSAEKRGRQWVITREAVDAWFEGAVP